MNYCHPRLHHSGELPVEHGQLIDRRAEKDRIHEPALQRTSGIPPSVRAFTDLRNVEHEVTHFLKVLYRRPLILTDRNAIQRPPGFVFYLVSERCHIDSPVSKNQSIHLSMFG